MFFNFRYFLLNILGPIFVGASIYIFFRADSLLVFDWLKTYTLLPIIIEYRQNTLPITAYLPNWFLYSLPDFLWVYAGTSYFLSIWFKQRNISSIFWINICFVLAIGAEFLQFYGLVEGTFDFVDIIFYTIGYLLAFKNIMKLDENQESENQYNEYT